MSVSTPPTSAKVMDPPLCSKVYVFSMLALNTL